MGWFRVRLSEEERRVVNQEWEGTQEGHVGRQMLVLWLCHCGLSREKTAEVAGLGRATVQRYRAAFRDGGLDGLRRWGVSGPVSDLAAHAQAIRQDLTDRPARTIAEAADRIEQLT